MRLSAIASAVDWLAADYAQAPPTYMAYVEAVNEVLELHRGEFVAQQIAGCEVGRWQGITIRTKPVHAGISRVLEPAGKNGPNP